VGKGLYLELNEVFLGLGLLSGVESLSAS
jgi:hypothetical protein